MKVISVEGFCVSSINYGESSKILNIITKEYGLIGVISKGCKGPKSKLKLVSEKFVYATFHIYYNENKLSTLIGADPINYLINIKSDILLISYISYISELVKNVYKQSNDEEIYNLFISSLLKIEDKFNPTIITNILELKLLDYLGVGINVDGCVICGRENVITFSSSKGGYVCAKCRTNEPVIDEKIIKMLRMYYYVDISKITSLDINEKIYKSIDRIMMEYYEEFTGLYLKSRKFLENIKK